MNTTRRLKETLQRALSLGSHDDEQELFDQLMVQKPHLLKLFDFGPRNLQEQKELESGKAIINKKATGINADFQRQAIFISQQLDLSEKYIAGILHDVMSSHPNINPVSSVEQTIATYHDRRRDLVECLKFLLEATEVAEAQDASPTFKRVATFVRTQLLPGTRTGGVEVTLPQKLFKEIESLEGVIAKADAATKNASSQTVAPTGQGTPNLGYDILKARLDSLKFERRNLAITLCSIARLGYLAASEIKAIVEWLSANSNHPMTYYLMSAVLLTLDPIDPGNALSSGRQFLSSDSSLVAFMTKKLEPIATWKDPALKATILLKWTLFLTEARHNDSTLEHKSGFKTDELETQIWNAVQGDAFKYLALSVIHIDAKLTRNATLPILEKQPSDPQDLREVPDADFKQVVLSSFETLLRSLITHASSELRKIKQRQEDLVLANARTDRNRGSTRFLPSSAPTPTDAPAPTARQDIALLYSFIGLLYSALPAERAIQFWGSGPQNSRQPTFQETTEATSGRLPAFLQWAVWSTPSQDLTMLAALYDMLSGLANGEQCSELAYNFMARGGGEVLPGSSVSSSASGPSVSWSVIFGILETWAHNSSTPRNPPPAQTRNSNTTSTFGTSFQNLAPPPPVASEFVITPQEVILARSFLGVLSTVVSHSVAVRTTVAGHAHFRAVPTLLSLIPLGIPLELKGAIFDTLCAFCQPGAGAPGVEICKAVWTLMERLEVINVRLSPSAGYGMTLAATKGVEMELEEVEAVHRTYPSTIPFLKLLATLIHTPKQLSFQDLTGEREPLNTIPETLGQPYRLPGIGPFTSFVVDNVFGNMNKREYSRSSDRWQINDLCLTFVERSLAGFDLESLVTAPEEVPAKLDHIVPLLVHPGYDIMKRMLTSSPLQAMILTYIENGLGGFEQGLGQEEPFYRSTITRVLRIVHRVLELQDIFLDVFIPLLSEFNSAPFVGQVYSRSYFIRFDQALSFGPAFIPALATYMAYPTYPELVLLSIKIVAKLSLSISPTTLVTLVQRSEESERILAGFAKIMSSEAKDDVVVAEENAERATGAGAPVIDAATEPLEQAIRLAALDLLIQDTEANRPYPNIAHFLLFGGTANEQAIQDPHALGARRTSIHVLLELVNAGVPRLKGKQRDNAQDHAIPLSIALPELAERCYRVVYQLCVHRNTSEFSCRYLRTREDFFARQLARVPAHAPEILQEPYIQALYGDGSRITTTVPALTSFLRLRSYIFDLVALELHVLTNKGHFKAVTELLEILFGTDTELEEEHEYSTFHELGQSPIRIIDQLQSLMFDWADSLAVEPIDMQFLNQVNLQSCLRTDSSGCEVVDRTAVVRLLSVGKAQLHSQGVVATLAQNTKLNNEIVYVLASCAVENHRRKVSHSRVTSFESWRRLLDIALTKCFDRLPHNRRENMLFDLLHVLPATMRSGNIEESTSVLLSETILTSITKLREDRQHQVILQSLGGDSESGSLPAERLHTILRNILDIILDNNHVELVRGNLYAALINFFHLIRSPHDPSASIEPESNPFGASLAVSTLRESAFLRRSSSVAPSVASDRGQGSSSLEISCLAVMKPALERLIATVARDAIDGTEVWKTVAFMLLDAAVQLSSLEKQHVVLGALTRHGILSNFVHSIKDSDSRLQGVLKPDPDDLNSLYVYEAKMSLFVRMTQSRAGAERLLDAQLMPILAQCDYLDTRPEADQAFIDQDSFLPPAIQRYHQLLMPALQVVDGMITTLGTRHTTATQQALNFLSNHGSTIAILLKNEDDYVTLPTLEEVHLIIALCTNILPSVPKAEVLSPNSGFGSIHLAILGLSTRCLGRGKMFAHVIPQSDGDVKLSQAVAFGYGAQSKFDVKVQRKERLLRKSVIAYIGAAGDFTEPEITLVLSPVTVRPRNDERMTHFAATIPTVGDALGALDDLCNDFATTLKQIADIGAELSHKGQIGADSVSEILREVDPVLLRDLTPAQKHALLARELGTTRAAGVASAHVLLAALEMLLLLLWRHVAYYSAPGAPPAQATVVNALRLLSTADPEGFRREISARLSNLVSKIQNLELDTDVFGKEWADNRGYIDIMCRRLKDSAGLRDEMYDDSNTDGDQ